MQGSNDLINWIDVNHYDPGATRYFRVVEAYEPPTVTPVANARDELARIDYHGDCDPE